MKIKLWKICDTNSGCDSIDVKIEMGHFLMIFKQCVTVLDVFSVACGTFLSLTFLTCHIQKFGILGGVDMDNEN